MKFLEESDSSDDAKEKAEKISSNVYWSYCKEQVCDD